MKNKTVIGAALALALLAGGGVSAAQAASIKEHGPTYAQAEVHHAAKPVKHKPVKKVAKAHFFHIIVKAQNLPVCKTWAYRQDYNCVAKREVLPAPVKFVPSVGNVNGDPVFPLPVQPKGVRIDTTDSPREMSAAGWEVIFRIDLPGYVFPNGTDEMIQVHGVGGDSWPQP